MTLAPATTRALRLTDAQAGMVHAELAAPDTADFAVGDAVVFRGRISSAHLAEAIQRTLAEVPWFSHRFDAEAMKLVPGPVPEPQPAQALPGDLHTADDQQLTDFLRERYLPMITLQGQLLHQRLLLADPRAEAQPLAVWVLVAHHVLIDGYGIALVARRVAEHYTALATGSPVSATPFTDPQAVLEAESAYHGSAAEDRDRKHWLGLLSPEGGEEYRPTRLAGLLGAAGQRPGPATAPRLRMTGPALQLDGYAPGRGAGARHTWADAAIAAHVLLANRLTGAGRVTVGLPAMNRTGAAALCPAPTINVLPLAVDVQAGASIGALLDAVAGARAALSRHGRFRSEQLMRELKLVGSDTTLTATEINIKAFDAPLEVPGATMALHPLCEGPVDDITLNLIPDTIAGTVRATLTAPPGTLAEADAAAVLGAYGQLLSQLVAADPDTVLSYLTLATAEQAAPLEGEPAAETTPPLLEELFAATVATAPHAPALRCAGEHLDYAQLAARVDRLAAALAGCGTGRYLLIDLERGIDYVAAILAAAKAGATSVPLDPQAPAARNQRIAHRLKNLAPHPPIVLTANAEAWLGYPVLDPAQLPDPAGPVSVVPVPRSTPAYLLHTSGSTGEPKAVVVSRDAFARWAGYHRHAGFLAAHGERIAQSLPLHFDGAWCTLLGIALGHEVHLVSHEVARDPQALAAEVREHKMTWMDMTPSLAAPLLETGLFEAGTPVRRLSVGGEGCSQVLWDKLRELSGITVENLYGPTEFTIDALVADVSDSPDVVVGRPLHGLRAMVLDPALRPLPPGLPGELYLAGAQQAHGYLGQSALTASRFIADPAGTAARMYRTGDRAVIGHDGLLRFLGRDDGQVKIRGYRIDVGEVESALVRLPGIRHAVVRARGQRLLAWVVPGSAAGHALAADPAQWREALGLLLPPQMIPHGLAVIEALPLGGTGKLDEAALPDPAPAENAGRTALQGPAQRAVAAAMARALGCGQELLGAASDFFAEGGDSISAIALVSGLREAGWTSSVGAVFAQRTVAAIAATATGHTAAPQQAAPDTPLVQLDDAARTRLASLLTHRRTLRQ